LSSFISGSFESFFHIFVGIKLMERLKKIYALTSFFPKCIWIFSQLDIDRSRSNRLRSSLAAPPEREKATFLIRENSSQVFWNYLKKAAKASLKRLRDPDIEKETFYRRMKAFRKGLKRRSPFSTLWLPCRECPPNSPTGLEPWHRFVEPWRLTPFPKGAILLNND